MKRFAGGADPIDLLEEREAISTLLPQTTVDNLSKNYGAYTIDPKTRYAALNEITPLGDVTHLYDTDDQTAIRLICFVTAVIFNVMRKPMSIHALTERSSLPDSWHKRGMQQHCIMVCKLHFWQLVSFLEVY